MSECGRGKVPVELVGDMVVDVNPVYPGVSCGVFVGKSWLIKLMELVRIQELLEVTSYVLVFTARALQVMAAKSIVVCHDEVPVAHKYAQASIARCYVGRKALDKLLFVLLGV